MAWLSIQNYPRLFEQLTNKNHVNSDSIWKKTLHLENFEALKKHPKNG